MHILCIVKTQHCKKGTKCHEKKVDMRHAGQQTILGFLLYTEGCAFSQGQSLPQNRAVNGN